MMAYIEREQALSHPFANGQYDHEHANEHYIFGFEDYKEWLEQLPTADVVEVVRCKDCKHNDGSCCDYSAVYTRPNGYCHWGERREE